MPASPTGDVNYVLRRVMYPAAGKGPELLKALEKRASTAAKGSVGAAISTQVTAPEGTNYIMSVLFSSLAGLEEYRKERTDPSRGIGPADGSLMRAAHGELFSVLLPFPS